MDIAVVTEKKYNLRNLGAKDIFSMSRIIAAIGIKNFKRCFKTEEIQAMIKRIKKEGNNEISTEAVGTIAVLEVADVLFENLPNCERELMTFIASLLGWKVADVEAIPPADFFDIVVEIINKPEFKDFFKRALQLLK